LDFSGIFFSSAISLQGRVAGQFAGLLLDCAFDFVKRAGCPECGSSNLTTVKNEQPLKHRCLDCLIFFAERDLKEKP